MTRFQIVGGALHFLHQIDGTRGKAKGAQSAVSRELLEVHAPGACGCVRVCVGSRARVRVRVRVHACACSYLSDSSCLQTRALGGEGVGFA